MMKKLLRFLQIVVVGVLFFTQVIFFIFFNVFLNLLENKNLFSCGDNGNNQKGIYEGNCKIIKIPTKIDFFKNTEIENIFVGETSTFIKTKS
jgi:hypothetical protein